MMTVVDSDVYSVHLKRRLFAARIYFDGIKKNRGFESRVQGPQGQIRGLIVLTL